MFTVICYDQDGNAFYTKDHPSYDWVRSMGRDECCKRNDATGQYCYFWIRRTDDPTMRTIYGEEYEAFDISVYA